jgi:hypothetical protein
LKNSYAGGWELGITDAFITSLTGTTDISFAGILGATSSVTLSGSGATSVTRTSASELNISSTDTNTVTRLQGTGGSFVSGDVVVQGTGTISTSQSGQTISIASSQNAFTTISTTSGTSPVADSSSDTLTISAGTGITVTGDSSTDTVTIATTGLVSQTNGTVTTAASGSGVVRNIYTSTSAPSGGIDGDVWMVYV